MGYDRGDSFSYPIQFERKWKYNFQCIGRPTSKRNPEAKYLK